MPSQRPFFLSSFFAAFRQQGPSIQSTPPQPNKHSAQTSSSATGGTAAYSTSSATASRTNSAPRTISAAAAGNSTSSRSPSASVAIHSPRGAVPIPGGSSPGRRRGSDSSSEGFRDVLGADKWYIGGRTAAGEEKFFKLGVVRRVRSNDGLSLDRLSL